jgi:uncharacterized iron-regulated membrane protein
VGPGAAIARALETYPGSQLAGVAFPDAESPWYRIRVLQPGESRRVFGTTTLFIGAHSGRVIGDFDALAAPPPRRFMDTLFPVHTGELAGAPGRLLIVAIGVWLLAMIALGLSLWATRRAAQRGRATQAGVDTR